MPIQPQPLNPKAPTPITGREYIGHAFVTPHEARLPFEIWAVDPRLVVLAVHTNTLWGEVIEVAAVDAKGKVMMNTRVKPTRGEVDPKATDAHGITAADLLEAEASERLLRNLLTMLTGKRVVAYNADYLAGRVAYSLDCALPGWRDTHRGLLDSPLWRLFENSLMAAGCIQSAYAPINGVFRQEYGSFSFTRLTAACAEQGVDYPTQPSALQNAQAVLALIHAVAQKEQPPMSHRPHTIDEKVTALLNPVLAECVLHRTELGIRKYGQCLDDNEQPAAAKAVHLIQELIDGMKCAAWLGEHGTMRRLAAEANLLQQRYHLTAKQINEGGKS